MFSELSSLIVGEKLWRLKTDNLTIATTTLCFTICFLFQTKPLFQALWHNKFIQVSCIFIFFFFFWLMEDKTLGPQGSLYSLSACFVSDSNFTTFFSLILWAKTRENYSVYFWVKILQGAELFSNFHWIRWELKTLKGWGF